MVLDSTVKSKKEKKTTLFSHGLRGLMNIHKSHDIPHTACKFKNYENVRKKGLKKKALLPVTRPSLFLGANPKLFLLFVKKKKKCCKLLYIVSDYVIIVYVAIYL